MLVKYPRTPHLPWSLGMTSDDKMIKTLEEFEGKEIVATEKLDGENTSMYRNAIHARSLDYAPEFHRTWVKTLHAKISYEIPENWRICGEDLAAVHSIEYFDLSTYFFVFSIWNEKNQCLSWDETVEYSKILDLQTVPVLYRGVFDEKVLRNLWKPTNGQNACEGYVIRLADSFEFDDFDTKVAKFVRPNHVQTDKHWKEHIRFNNLRAS